MILHIIKAQQKAILKVSLLFIQGLKLPQYLIVYLLALKFNQKVLFLHI